MDPAQFKEYTDGMTVLERTRNLRRHHKQCKQALIRQTTPCDGTSPAGVRAWFKDIELAGAEVGAENHWQFKEYTDGMTVLKTTRNLRRHHEQCKQALIRQTTPCDGTSPAGVRASFKDIELAGAAVGAENHWRPGHQ